MDSFVSGIKAGGVLAVLASVGESPALRVHNQRRRVESAWQAQRQGPPGPRALYVGGRREMEPNDASLRLTRTSARARRAASA
ncbi:MAG: hypothetical protein AMXMBFR72_20250 [Betaproteobacteria bacterium]|nr:MAG: hypothetical protein BroJett031_31450 [Betaproteobacteria bacterium]